MRVGGGLEGLEVLEGMWEISGMGELGAGVGKEGLSGCGAGKTHTQKKPFNVFELWQNRHTVDQFKHFSVYRWAR